MRIVSLEVSGFRGFAGTAKFDLAADAIILVGVNGQGKTSFFDALLWGITGSVPRLRVEDKGLLSLYSESGEFRVSLKLQDTEGNSYQMVRSFDGAKQNLKLTVNADVFSQDAARLRLLELLWPGSADSTDGEASLTSAFVRSIYLQQDLVRQFIDADDEQQRFSVIGELLGAGQVTELQLQLERSKVAWVKALNSRIAELAAVRERLAALEAQLAKLDRVARPSALTIERWTGWWKQLNSLEKSDSHPPAPESNEAPTLLDSAIRRIQALQNANERSRQSADTLLKELHSHQETISPDASVLDAEIGIARSSLDQLRQALVVAEGRATEFRKLIVQRKEERAELSALAQLALRHLGETCPVCNQSYDVQATRQRLSALAQELSSTSRVEDTEVQGAVTKAADAVAHSEGALIALVSRQQKARESVREYESWVAGRDRTLRQLGIVAKGDEEIAPRLNAFVAEAQLRATALQQLMREGEQLALLLAHATEQTRRAELEKDVLNVRSTAEDLAGNVSKHEETERLASLLLDGLREASTEVVEKQLRRIEPLLQRIFARIDAHPAFRAVRFLTRFSNRRGRLYTEMLDPLSDVTSESPAVVLSSSQMNALAVSVFIALNLGLPRRPLDAVLLDDPLQSLDDVNLLGLVDLLRRTKDQRQLIVSTHDPRFGKLLERKLRAVHQNQRTTAIEFSDWHREGPTYSQRDVSRDERPMRIAVAS
jgi:DNA repair exonuclease SbcCD ATPase subunit